MRWESVGLPVPFDVVDAGFFASNTSPQGEFCIRELSVVNGTINVPKIKLLTVLYFRSPHLFGTLWPCQRRHPYPCITDNLSVRDHFQEFTTMILYHRRNQCRGYEERKEESIHAFTVTQYHNECNAALRGSGHHCLHCQKWLRPQKLVWRLQIEISSTPALKIRCDIPIPFICYLRPSLQQQPLKLPFLLFLICCEKI